MKKSTIIIAVVLILSTLFSFALPVTADKEADYTAKEVTAYYFGMEKSSAETVLLSNKVPGLVLVNVGDYISAIHTIEYGFEHNSDGTYTYTATDSRMVVDPKNDTLYFDKFNDFVADGVFVEGSEEDAPYLSFIDYVYDGAPDAFLDLAEYGIDVVEYGDEPYISLSTLNTVFILTYNGAEFVDGILYYSFIFEDPYYDRASLYESGERSKEMADYSYRELCFTMDHFYGMPSSAKIAGSIKEKGFDKTLDEYDEVTARAKVLLKSTDRTSSYIGLSILQPYFYDGGHTIFYYDFFGISSICPGSPIADAIDKNYYSDNEDWKLMRDAPKENNDFWMGYYEMVDIKNKALEAYTPVKIWEDAEASLYVKGDTAMFCFDTFINEVVEPFRWSLEYAKKHNIRNFLIDLSTNSGGSTAVVDYMIAAITIAKTGKNEHTLEYVNTLTGAKYASTTSVDLNLDGKFDEKDKQVSYNFNFAILTSSISFSCGNLMPFIAKDFGIAIIGDVSGGGECCICKYSTPEFGYFYMSSIDKFTVGDASLDDGAAVDFAVYDPVSDEVAARLASQGIDDPAALRIYDFTRLYDIETVGDLAEQFYGENGVQIPDTGEDKNGLLTAAAVSFVSLALIVTFAFALTVGRKKFA